jgi:predicted RNA-binding Zn ribbon-like protein
VVNADATDPDEFPVIGEPLPIEFANSLYESEGEAIDFLATPRLMHTWFELVDAGAGLPSRLRRVDGDAIRELRNAVRVVFCDLANGTVPDGDAVSVLNLYAARGPWSLQLDVGHDGSLALSERRGGTIIDATLGRLASEAIALAAGSSGQLLRQCKGPGCAMLFVKDHHKRRWCDHSCGHRARQAAYYRRKKAHAAHPT